MSNYPDGMTSRDWSMVNGPDYEEEREEQRDVDHECPESYRDEDGNGFSGEVTATVTDCGPYYMLAVSWDCPRCGMTVHEDEDWKED